MLRRSGTRVRSTAARAAAIGLLIASGAVLLITVGRSYMARRGLPLDDAWIHAVYGRELSRTGMVAYNPGEPATGETSLMWAAVAAAAHAGAGTAAEAIARTKWLGFALHAAAAAALACGALAPGASRTASFLGAALVLFNPALLAASVSGMEVPLASCVAVGLAAAAARGTPLIVFAASFVAPLARPELAACSLVLAALMPLARGCSRRRAVVAAAGGTAACFLTLAVRNLSVSGFPLPATFYAKFGRGGAGPADSLWRGFRLLLPALSELLAPAVVLPLGLLCAAILVRRRRESEAKAPNRVAAAAVILTSIVFFAVSFVASPPVDPDAFYHQRYALPLLTLFLGGLPILVAPFLRGSGWARAVALCLGAFVVAREISHVPARFRRLENDAHNIDDVQVALGKSLGAEPRETTVWAVDAGAIRYFGSARVVDMMGLNSPALLGAGPGRFLDSVRPTILEVVPSWSALSVEAGGIGDVRAFAPSTPYTVTSYPAMAVHHLVRCTPGARGTYAIRSRTFRFTCAP